MKVTVLTKLKHPHIVRFFKFMSETRHQTEKNGTVRLSIQTDWVSFDSI